MKPNGFATILMLMVLLSAGAYLGVQQHALNIHPESLERQERLRTVAQAKQSLLHYTSTYNDLYGPSGSGPGHLPCPDTDAYRGSSSLNESSPFFGDSPNPPCGGGNHTRGYLPRHVSLVDSRYAFHAQATQDIWYQLATSHVNNPVNRVVNSSREFQTSLQREVVKLVSASSDVIQQHGYLVAPDNQYDYVTLPVTHEEILNVSTKRVQKWFVDGYQASRAKNCEEHGRCNAIPEAIAECRDLLTPELHKLLWLHQETEIPTCDVHMLEQTPLSRHWFMRNRWPENLHITVHGDCHFTHFSECLMRRQDEQSLVLAPAP